MLSTLPELPVKKFGNRIKLKWGFPGGPMVKNMHANAEMRFRKCGFNP